MNNHNKKSNQGQGVEYYTLVQMQRMLEDYPKIFYSYQPTGQHKTNPLLKGDLRMTVICAN